MELKMHFTLLTKKSTFNSKVSGFQKYFTFDYYFSLNLTMYRHWSLLESLKYSSQTACHFQLWTLKGEKKLNEFLAELG